MDPRLYTVMELIDSDIEHEDTDALLCQIEVHLIHSNRKRIPNHYENAVGCYCEFEFRRLFRLSRDTFESFARRFESSHFSRCFAEGARKF